MRQIGCSGARFGVDTSILQSGVQASGRHPGRPRLPFRSPPCIFQVGYHPKRLGILSVPPHSNYLHGSALTYDIVNLVWKRRKDLLYLGSVHGADLPELYGVTGDHLAADAISMPVSSSSISSRQLMGVRQSTSSTTRTPTTRRVLRPRAYCRTSPGPSTPSTARGCFCSVTMPLRSIPLPLTHIERMLSLPSSNFSWLWDSENTLPFSKWIVFPQEIPVRLRDVGCRVRQSILLV